MESSSCSSEATTAEGGSAHAESVMTGSEGQYKMPSMGVGTMQYQGSGMAPHEPLHPEGPEGSGTTGVNSYGEASGYGLFAQPEVPNGGMPSNMAAQPQMMGGMIPPQGMAAQPQMMGGMIPPQGMAAQPQMMGGMIPPQGMAAQPQMMGGMIPPQGMAAQPQMMGGMIPPQGMAAQPQMMGGMIPPQGMVAQPQMMGGMIPPQGMAAQPQMMGGMVSPQGLEAQPQPQMQQAASGQAQESAVGDMNRYGQYLEIFTDMASGKTPELPQIAEMVQQAPGDFWKGAIVGAAAGFIFTSETVRDGIGSVIGAMFAGAEIAEEETAEE